MHLDERQVLDVSRDLWTSQLGLNLAPREADGLDTTNGEKVWSSCVKVSGPWSGAIVLQCPESIGRHAAAMLFSSDGETTTEEEIQDAVDELAEMIGKKLRTHLPETAKLSRPAAVPDIVEEATPLAGMHGQGELKLDCEGRPVRIAIFEGEPDLAAAS
jgi:hypothetical protein